MKHAETEEYYRLLSDDFPEWLGEYAKAKKLQNLRHISMTCGMVYSGMFGMDTFYSTYDHSIAVALMMWHFTKNKKQVLCGLFHDISTPSFKHCVDYMNGDHFKQEYTESLTTEFIEKSADIMKLLKRDGIDVSDVDDCHSYPILDNDTPRLSVDRLEYTLSGSLYTYHLLTLDEVKEVYDDIEVQNNEDGVLELGFKTKSIARKFVRLTSKLSLIYRDDKNLYSAQLIADLLRRMSDDGLIKVEQLYELKESEIISMIKTSKYKDIFEMWQNAKRVKTAKERPDGVYFVHQKTKVRYIDPLCNGERMSKICKLAKKTIDNNLAYKMDNYVYLDFKF